MMVVTRSLVSLLIDFSNGSLSESASVRRLLHSFLKYS